MTTEQQLTLHGHNVTQIVRDNGRVENHLLAPKKYRELMLDFSFNNLESVLNKAQINSYTSLFLHSHNITDGEFDFESDSYRIKTTTSKKYYGNDVPIHLVPKDMIRKTVDSQRLLARDDVTPQMLKSCYSSAYFTMSVRSGTFQNMATELISRESLLDDDVSADDALLGTIWSLQEKQNAIDEDFAEGSANLRELLLPFAEEMTEDAFGGVAVYLYATKAGDKTDSRVSLTKQRKLNTSAATKWVNSQDIFDADEVLVDKPDSIKIRKEAPEIYDLGCSDVLSIEVTEL